MLRPNCLRAGFGTLIALVAAALLPDAQSAAAQGGATIPIEPLQRFTVPDGTASAMLPEGWKVVYTSLVMLRAEGPKGELAIFGIVVPARDGPVSSGAISAAQPLSQPYDADLREKFARSVAWVRESNHQPAVHVEANAPRPINAPAIFGQCGKMTANLDVPQRGKLLAEADFCSMPKEADGSYRNFFKLVAAPANVATAERGTLETMLASYRIDLCAVRRAMIARGASIPPGIGSDLAARCPKAPPLAGGAGAMPRPGPMGQMSRPMPQMGGQMPQSGQMPPMGGFNPQLAQFQMQAAQAIMSSTQNMMNGANESADIFDRETLRGQIPLVSVDNHPLVWLDPN